jgi:hypothetical protein
MHRRNGKAADSGRMRVSAAEYADGVVERLGLLQVAHVTSAPDHDLLAKKLAGVEARHDQPAATAPKRVSARVA